MLNLLEMNKDYSQSIHDEIEQIKKQLHVLKDEPFCVKEKYVKQIKVLKRLLPNV